MNKIRMIKRTAEMSAELLRDPARTGAWRGAENVARQFDRIARLAGEAAGPEISGTEDDVLHALTENFWQEFRWCVAHAMRQCPEGREDELMVRLSDKTSVYGSAWETVGHTR